MKHATEIETIFAGFLPWVQSKPRDEAYDYCAHDNCALAQYLHALGFAQASVGSRGFSLRDEMDHPIPNALHDALAGLPETFGALADRLGAAK